MNFGQIYLAYLTRYLGDVELTIDTTDPEWQIAIQGYNTAVRRWNNVDGVLWNELWTTYQQNSPTIFVNDATAITCPSNMESPGGNVTLGGAANPTFKLPVISPESVQNYAANNRYAYFTGNPHNGYNLHLNTGGGSTYNGYTIDFPYYAKPTYLNSVETGSTLVQMRDPEFAINTMLSLRFLQSRNYPAQQVAERDATQSLANMEVRNSMGAPGAAWQNNPLGSGWGY